MKLAEKNEYAEKKQRGKCRMKLGPDQKKDQNRKTRSGRKEDEGRKRREGRSPELEEVNF
jgi:hypothetical protein